MADTLRMLLTDEHVHCFQSQGFLRLGRLTTEPECEWLRDVAERIVWFKTLLDQSITPREAYTPEALPIDKHASPALVTIVSPEQFEPALMNTLLLRNARRMISRLLEVEEAGLLSGWRLFLKPAGGGETPWHQDAAYRPPPHRSASVWMPLDDVTLDNGCMHYIGGSHRGAVRSHHVHNNHLRADIVDASQAVACPLLAGEAVVHHCLTLHRAGPNTTNEPRRALVVVCQVRSDRQDK